MIAASEWHLLLYGLALLASLFGKAQYSRMSHKHEDEVRRAEQTLTDHRNPGSLRHSRTSFKIVRAAPSLRIPASMAS